MDANGIVDIVWALGWVVVIIIVVYSFFLSDNKSHNYEDEIEDLRQELNRLREALDEQQEAYRSK